MPDFIRCEEQAMAAQNMEKALAYKWMCVDLMQGDYTRNLWG